MPTEELFGNYNFLLEVSELTGDAKILMAGFKSLSGMDSETEIVEFREGSGPTHIKPGVTTYTDIVLERGYTPKQGVFDAWQAGEARSGSVVILDRDGETEIGRYNFQGGAIVQLTPAIVDFDDKPNNGFAIERLRIRISRVKRG